MNVAKGYSSVGPGSQPLTGALNLKSIGSRMLVSHASKGDSINYISLRAPQQYTAIEKEGKMQRKERTLGTCKDETEGKGKESKARKRRETRV